MADDRAFLFATSFSLDLKCLCFTGVAMIAVGLDRHTEVDDGHWESRESSFKGKENREK